MARLDGGLSAIAVADIGVQACGRACRRERRRGLASAGLPLAGFGELAVDLASAGLCSVGLRRLVCARLGGRCSSLRPLFHRLGGNLRLELGDLGRRARRPGIDDDRRHRARDPEQVASALGARSADSRTENFGPVSRTVVAGRSCRYRGRRRDRLPRWPARRRCRPHISSFRSGGAASIGVSVSTVPSDGVSQDSGP